MNRRLFALRLWLARKLTPEGFVVSRTVELADATITAGELFLYATRSGHLTRDFKAGRRVRELAVQISKHLGAA